jgi:hypothetical protein
MTPTEQARAALEALDAAKHAMADVRSWLDRTDHFEAWHRLNRGIADAEAVLAALLEPLVQGETITLDAPKHVDCDCMECRPWTY